MSAKIFWLRFAKVLVLSFTLASWGVMDSGCRGGLEPTNNNNNTNSTNNTNDTNNNTNDNTNDNTNTGNTNDNTNTGNTNNGNTNNGNTNNTNNTNNNNNQPPKKATVKDVQDPKSSNYVGKGNGVILKEVIVLTPLFRVNDNLQGFFVADPSFPATHGGVMVVVGKADLKSLKIGDVLDIEGFADEYFGNTQVNASSAKGGFVTPTNNNKASDIKPTVVKPEDIPAAPASKEKSDESKAEPYEGMLVELKDVTVEEGPDKFGAWKIQGGVLVEDTMFKYKPKKGDKIGYVRGVLHYTFDQYRLVPRYYKDIDGAKAACDANNSCGVGQKCLVELGACRYIKCAGDSDCNTGEKCDTATERCELPLATATIKQVRDTSDPKHIKVGAPVELKAVVATSKLFKVSTNLVGFFVTDLNAPGKFGGILVVTSKDFTETVEIGDELDVKGKVAEYFSGSQITVDLKNAAQGIKKTGNNKKTEIKATVVKADDVPSKPADKNNPNASKTEPYESVLVELQNVTVDDVPNKFGEFTVGGGLVSVDDLLYKHTPAKGDKITTLRGVLYFSFGFYRLLPRSADDIVK